MKFFTALLVFVFTHSAFAGELTGKLVFDKKAPFAGVLFVADNAAGPNKTTIDQRNAGVGAIPQAI